MQLKLIFENFKEDKGFVKTVEPLSFTMDQNMAMAYDMELETLDAKAVGTILKDICMASDTSEYILHFFNLKEDGSLNEDLCRIEIDFPSLSASINRSCSVKEAKMFKSFTAELQGYIIDITMELSFRKARSSEEDTEDGSACRKLASELPSGASSAKVEKVIDQINNKTKATVVKPKETLKDYVCDNVLQEELSEIVDFFANADAYTKANVKIPVGILFKGLPGTGKTYAARCIAGSTDAYFLTCTASSLQGMYIGSGAENIRNLFNGAKELQEASGKGVIIFIDELDSLGSRASHANNSSDEADRTLNQLLAEMSGFDDTKGIMVLAATNYADRLDDALMRSGRFSRQINIDYPETKERFHLVEYYFEKLKLKLNEDVTYDLITDLTDGLSPADIKDIANESAIMTIRYKDKTIPVAYINEAINKVITKNIRKPDSETTDYKLIAAHECGHVLAEYLYENTLPIKVTNYSYGNAGGFTQSKSRLEGILPREKFIAYVKTLLAGRAAEEVLCGCITNGASNDLSKAKKILRMYYETYNFEVYSVETLDQLIIDKLETIYGEVVSDFTSPEHRDRLQVLAEMLCSERILYTSDIASVLINKEEDIL